MALRADRRALARRARHANHRHYREPDGAARQPVPWGSRERAGEVTKLMADHRAEGAGNCFYSIAPDDVHNALSIRYSFPYRGRDVLGGGREDGVGEGGGGGGGARGPSGRDRGA